MTILLCTKREMKDFRVCCDWNIVFTPGLISANPFGFQKFWERSPRRVEAVVTAY